LLAAAAVFVLRLTNKHLLTYFDHHHDGT